MTQDDASKQDRSAHERQVRFGRLPREAAAAATRTAAPESLPNGNPSVKVSAAA